MREWVASIYDSLLAEQERLYYRDIRKQLLEAAGGKSCLEIGAGTGSSISAWPSTVERLVMTEPSENMLKRLRPKLEGEEGKALPVKPEVLQVALGGAGSLPFDDNTFDTLLVSLVFCHIEQQVAACNELKRVAKDGAKIVFLEHVTAKKGSWARLLAPFFNWLWLLLWGCSAMRDTHETFAQQFHQVDINWLVLPFRMTGIDNHYVYGTATVKKS